MGLTMEPVPPIQPILPDYKIGVQCNLQIAFDALFGDMKENYGEMTSGEDLL